MRRLGGLIVAGLVVFAVSACSPPLETPGDVRSVQLVSSSTLNGWKYDYYRNSAYPCSVSGYQTFVVGTKTGSSNTAPRPLWVMMHGGGAGYFDENGQPIPSSAQKVEESAASLNARRSIRGSARSHLARLRRFGKFDTTTARLTDFARLLCYSQEVLSHLVLTSTNHENEQNLVRVPAAGAAQTRRALGQAGEPHLK